MKFRVDEKDLKIFICFSILLLYLCAVAVLNLHSLATSGTIYGFVPFEAFSKEFIAPTLILFFLILLGIMFSVSSYFLNERKVLDLLLRKKIKGILDGVRKKR